MSLTSSTSFLRPLAPKLAPRLDQGRHDVDNVTTNASPRGSTARSSSPTPSKAALTICDGSKPKCSICIERRQQCTYQTSRRVEMAELRTMAQEHGRLLELLRTASPDSVVALVKSLRGSASQSSHLNDLRAGLAPAHPPLHMDLNSRYPNAFAVLEPLHTANVDFRLIDVDKSSAITARNAHKRSRTCGPWTTKLGNQGSPCSELPSTVSRLPTAESINYVDPRLHNLDIGQWTSVSISDLFAAQAISFYLRNEHPYLALFDSDLFLEDLTTGKGQFCTELLVSSLLAWSCASYAQFETEAKRLSPIFLDEGKRRWDARRTHAADLCAVPAAVLLAMTCNQHGKDRVGLTYLDASAEIALQLGLFDRTDAKTKHIRFEDKRVASAASYVAWGTFSWHTLHCLYFRRRHGIGKAPSLPIPGDEQGLQMAYYMGNSFTWIAKFWLIVFDYFYDGYTAYVHSTLQEAELVYMTLLEWSRQLPESCRRSEFCAHHVLLMHIWYHTVILDVWRSFLPRNRKGNLQSFSSPDNTPVAAYNASIRQLKRLVYQFRKSYEATNLSILVTPGYLYLVNEVFRNCAAPDAQFYFLLATHGYLAIGPWCRGISGIAKALLSFGDRMGVFDRAEWTMGLIETVRTAIEELDRNETYSSLYPIDLDADHDGIKTGNMEVLANEFGSLAVQRGLPHKKPWRGRVGEQEQEQLEVWKGDQRDLSLTLGEVAGVDGRDWDEGAM
ncbi:hypothetical protein E4U43_001078 [Claviceps pusilla]|uniref:Nitrate assimilation regulatory protein nirA n=1 Tax=Claviceps pusilla TaxID=123648 RepID=A0A9P7SZL4_9HYPO|nr:hypothetical protein E4U43_001078 [Claviceps pusilla]